MEHTFVILKPDALERGLVGQIISRIEGAGLTFLALDLVHLDRERLSQHYGHLLDKPFFPSILDYMTSGPVLTGILRGPDAVKTWRALMGATNPAKAEPGTIRRDFGQLVQEGQTLKNLVHGSDSLENAQKEIGLWYPDFARQEASHV